jgi:hypothetical protein
MVLGGLCYVRVSHPGWVNHTLFMHIRSSPSLRLPVGLTVCLAGLVLLTWAWWSLRRFALDEVDGVRRVRTAVVWWSIPLLFAPPLFSGDGWSYVATGYLTGHRLSPYVWTPHILPPLLRSGVSPRWRFTPSPYGPLALGWGGLASKVTSNPWLLLAAYRVLALLGLALLAWATPRLARRCGRNPGEASWLVLASPFVMAHGVGGLHNDLVMIGLGAAALTVTRRDHWVWGAVLAGSAAAVKVPGGLVAVGVVLLSLDVGAGLAARIRRTAQVGGVVGGTLLGLGLVTGVGMGWVSTLSVPTLVPTQLSVTYDTGLSVDRFLLLVRGSAMPSGHEVINLVQGLGALLVCAFAAGLLLRRRAAADGTVLASVAVLMLAVTVLSPIEHYWYFLWCLPLLACVRMSPAAQATLTCAVVVLGLSAVADPSLPIEWLGSAAVLALAWLPALTYAAMALRSRSTPPHASREPERTG